MTKRSPSQGKSDGISVEERAALDGLVPDLLARRFAGDPRSYGQIVWGDFCKHRAALTALCMMGFMALVAIFAPLLPC